MWAGQTEYKTGNDTRHSLFIVHQNGFRHITPVLFTDVCLMLHRVICEQRESHHERKGLHSVMGEEEGFGGVELVFAQAELEKGKLAFYKTHSKDA